MPCLLFQACRRPIFEFHAERQPARSRHFLDLVERFTTKIRRLEQFVFAALNQIADVINILGFQAICRTHGQFKIVDRTQQNWINRRSTRRSFGGRLGAFQRGKDIQQNNQHAGGRAGRGGGRGRAGGGGGRRRRGGGGARRRAGRGN